MTIRSRSNGCEQKVERRAQYGAVGELPFALGQAPEHLGWRIEPDGAWHGRGPCREARRTQGATMRPDSHRRRVLGLIAAVGLLVVADQLSKAAVRGAMAPGDSLSLIDGVLQITFHQNFGLSWWIPALPSWTKWVLRFLLLVVAVMTLPVYLFYTSTRRQGIWADVAATGLMASSCGHLADDIFVPYATDFIRLWSWPSGNLADVYARVGLVALAMEMILLARERKPKWRGIRHLVAGGLKARRELYEFLRDEVGFRKQGKRGGGEGRDQRG